MEGGVENIGDRQGSVGETVIRPVSRRLARCCSKSGSRRREPEVTNGRQRHSHTTLLLTSVCHIFSLLFFFTVASWHSTQVDYASARQQQRGEGPRHEKAPRILIG